MDDVLRHKLWNTLDLCLWQNCKYEWGVKLENSNLYTLFLGYWHYLFKLPVDLLPQSFSDARQSVREHFYGCPWNEVYDLIEFTAKCCPDELRAGYIESCNAELKTELSAYRLVDSLVTDITSEEEIKSIETAICSTTKYSGTNKHLQTALELLSDRKKPDYRNSIKESISAVESLCIAITGVKESLGPALKKIKALHSMHPAFIKALDSLYGYTSDSSGIRHALLEESSVNSSDARFMLVVCSAFINYVLGKTSEEK